MTVTSSMRQETYRTPHKDFWTISFLVCAISLPRSYLLLKLVFILIFVAREFLKALHGAPVTIYPRILYFYCFVTAVGSLWSLVGLIYGHSAVAILDNLRLYVAWSLAYLIIFTLLRNGERRQEVHLAIVMSGLLITAMNLIGVLDFSFQLGLVSEQIRKELDMFVGFHEGYVQITSHNIGSLFFVVPYLIALQFRRDSSSLNTPLTKVSLVLCIVIAVLSGRRALWLCLVLTPLLIGTLSIVCRARQLLTSRGRTLLILYAGFLLSVPLTLFGLDNILEAGPLQHLSAAFSAEDERSIQLGYLVDSFKQYPLFGSGFGGYAGYTRNDDAPWLYELTYFQILFNFGIIGVLCIVAVFGFYLHYIVASIRRQPADTAFSFASLVGLSSFLVGVYSNPYLGSFDFLLYLGLLPFLATYISSIGNRPTLFSSNSTLTVPSTTGGRT